MCSELTTAYDKCLIYQLAPLEGKPWGKHMGLTQPQPFIALVG